MPKTALANGPYLSVPDGYHGPASISSEFSVDYVDTCGGGRAGLYTANVDDVIVCFNFLVALGDYLITVEESDQLDGLPYFRQVAIYNTAVVEGHSLREGGTASIASDVALGVQWVFTYCNSGGQVAG